MQYSKYVYSFAIDSNNVALYHSLLIRTIFLTKAEIDQVKDESLLIDLSDADEARKAFIASEIFNRKYE